MASPREQEPTDVNVYVNWARVLLSPFELALDLGYRADEAPPEDFPVRAVMTWEQAKLLVQLLQDAVVEYEKEVGEIRDFGMEVGLARDVSEEELPEGEGPEHA